jgi:hypothetical protein
VTSEAALIEVDLFSSDDSLITRDTENGFDWLDLTETLNLSYNEIEAGIGGGGERLRVSPCERSRVKYTNKFSGSD